MPGNSFGHLFRITTFGESHGGAVGVVIDGVTPRVPLCEADIQVQLDRRKPGQSSITTPRTEPDTVHILSGVFEGQTTGTPLLLLLYNQDARPQAYDAIRDVFRPGHADFTYLKKYGIRDHRGSGRASGRETAARVAAGAVARKILAQRGVKVTGYTIQIGTIRCIKRDLECIEQNPVRACDPDVAGEMVKRIERCRDEGNSIGGIVECRIDGVPAGLGEPVFNKLEAELAHGIMSLGAVKGFEIGSGFMCAEMTGREHNDAMNATGFLSNNAGGIIGGISTGEPIIFRAAVKPTASIASPQKTIDRNGNEVTIGIEGRHDPCICPRIVPVIEAMACIVIEDHFKLQAGLLG